MSSIALATSLGGFFQDAVDAALQARHLEATRGAASYLAALLSELAHPDPAMEHALDCPLAFLLDEAVQSAESERLQRFKTLGDAVLYLAGFFGDHIEHRGVDKAYVASVGATAYLCAAATARRRRAWHKAQRARQAQGQDEDSVFGELSAKFDGFVEVLTTVADTALARQARGQWGILKLYERWLRSGSPALAAELGTHGLLPVRGPGGVH